MPRAQWAGVMLVAYLAFQAHPVRSAHVSIPSGPHATFTIPRGNVAWSGPVLDDRHVVYGAAVPRFHRPVCVSCGRPPFTKFDVRMYIRDYQRRSTSITVSEPRVLFDGPRGAQLVVYALVAGWLVYDSERPYDKWQLYTRNVDTGRAILLDSPKMEGLPSRFLGANTDGRTVVWQSWTRLRGRTMSVIRSFTLATGRRGLLLAGGSGIDYFDGDPEIAGNHLIFVREPGSNPGSQIFVKNLATGRVRALTPPGQSNFAPVISGNIVAWEHGSLTPGHAHGIVVANLATGRRVAVKRSSSQLPRVVGGRYVVFAPDYPTPYPKGNVQVYDALTGRRRIIAVGPDAAGFVPNWTVEAGGDAALVEMDKPCSGSNGVCPTHFRLVPVGLN
ncbi:MAG TPA: hypothetical protein VKX16_14185 [Chloroflexota bacterium]|nr:hypothetical protein [Chloroflexota bacterium]